MQVKTTYHPAECSVCSRPFTLLSGGVEGCAAHGVRQPKKPERIIASCRNPRRLLTISHPEALNEPHLYAVSSLVAQLVTAGVLDAGVKVEQIGADKRGRFYVWGVESCSEIYPVGGDIFVGGVD